MKGRTNHSIFRGKNSGILLAIAFLLTISPMAIGTGMQPNFTVMNSALERAFHRGDQNFEVIVRFQGEIKPQDYHVLRGLNVEIKKTLNALPSVFVVVDRAQLVQLSHYSRIEYMELNVKLEYFMHDTTRYINATVAWTSLLEDRYGNIIKNQDGTNRYIDGSGVTVVILDTGIDAGHPDFDYKDRVIINLKRTEAGWTEQENTDTSSGHGTHCAGTAAGNGDASSGARSGVAKGANLIGLGTGEGLSIIYALEGLEWVYENSKPDHNPYNIRVVSNSWGTGGNEDVYDPESSITLISEKLVYENHVSVIFAAGNDGGDGTSVKTNPYSNTPAVISVAAMERDGRGVADFSSRGNKEKQESWPDIGAPGHVIWSCAPRETVIDVAQRPTDHELYYMEISGTSMATPHVAGATALLWEAAPHMRISNVHEDYSGPNPEAWYNNTRTLISEPELILKLTARYMRGVPGVPSESASGVAGRPHDFAQGYGYIDMRAAVGLALTLEKMRTEDKDNDGFPDNPNATVFDAYKEYYGLMAEKYVTGNTNVLRADWSGDWAHFEKQAGDPSLGTYSTNTTKFVYIPKETMEIQLTLSYAEYNTERAQAVNLYLTRSLDGGETFSSMTPQSVNEGVKYYVLRKGSDFSESDTGKLWAFRTEGTGVGVKVNDEFFEPIAYFTVSLVEILDISNGTVTMDFLMPRSYVAQLEFGTPTADYQNGIIEMKRYVYLYPIEAEEREEEEKSGLDGFTTTFYLIAVGLAFIVMLHKKRK